MKLNTANTAAIRVCLIANPIAHIVRDTEKKTSLILLAVASNNSLLQIFRTVFLSELANITLTLLDSGSEVRLSRDEPSSKLNLGENCMTKFSFSIVLVVVLCGGTLFAQATDNPYKRYPLSQETRQQIWENARESNTGQVRDPLTVKFMPPQKSCDAGHETGMNIPSILKARLIGR
ncbi:MAG: hypothetical protein LBC74_05485 [Planctomycetaceae bacterium]|nr:hypothetical protein [Planctomycetaceae bacterium]